MEYTNQPSPSEQQDIDAGRTVAILAYITLIGWIVAIVMHTNNPVKSKFAVFHLRQALGIYMLALGIIIPIFLIIFILPFFVFLIPLIQLGIIVLSILQIIQAINGKKQGIPLAGPFIDKTLSFIN